jgi:UDP-N-acetylglucosamine--N-acetylmuramyl-(pentapeptide) pyrophosphoryl-undecaprenol N-acetylglucosamine transferase
MKTAPRVIVSGGGTGGHIFPAVAIANAIKAQYPDAEILFVGAKGKMEMEKVPKAGYPIKGLWISGLQRKLTLQNLSFPFKVISSLWNSRKIIKSFNPDLAIGVGGFASGPLLQMAAWMKVKTLIHESNSFPGITNKILAKNVNTICVAFPGMDKYFPIDKLVITGNPVRKEILKLEGKRTRAAEMFGLDEHKPTLLVIGGSQGARSINQAILAGLKTISELGIQLVWQTGESFAKQANDATQAIGNQQLKTYPFIYEMDYAYAMADLVVSRAGAMSISELSLVKKPAILVPFPFAAEDHQTKNAQTLVNYNAGVLVEDKNAQTELIPEVQRLITQPDELDKLSLNIAGLKAEDATGLIMNEVMKLLNQKK